MKQKLLLLTNGFPFGENERGFLPAEFSRLTEMFEVYVLAKINEPPQSEWSKLDYDRSKVFCTGETPLTIPGVLGQIFHRDTLAEIRRAFRDKGNGRLFIKRIGAILRYRARACQYEAAIGKICTEQEIKIVYTYWCTQATLGALMIKKQNPELKVVTRFHGYDLYQERTEELWQPFRTDIADGCGLLIFACKSAKEYFLNHWKNTNTKKTALSYLGCREMEPVIPAEDGRLHLVSCSNLIPLKRVDRIIDGLAALPESVQVDWHHIGDGALRQSLENYAGELLNGHRNISWTFHGAIPNTDINRLYQKLHADVFITTSSTEGLPVSVQEALAMGIPCIGTDVGGICELIITKKTGWLLSSDPNTKEIAWAIEEAARLSNPQMHQLRQGAVHHWSEIFNSMENAANFVRVLNTAVNSKDD